MLKRISKTFRVALAAGLFLSAQAFAQSSSDHEFVIRNARIFDGSRIIPTGDVWVKNGTIQAVGQNIPTPAGIREIDGTGRTLLPGLIDAHVHTVGNSNFLKSALALGVTTELDMGAAPDFADKIEKEQAEGKGLDLADLRSSRTQPTAPDGHGTEYGIPIPTVSSPAEAPALVDALIAEGADFIGEIEYDDGSEFGLRIPTLSKETLRALIQAAHRRGKLAVVHVLAMQAAKDAIEAGADGLAHLFADRPADDEFISLAAQHRVFVIPTLSVLASISGVSTGPSLARNPRLEPYLSSQAIADLKQELPRHAGALRNAEEAVRLLNAEQVPILAGTDAHNPGTAHGASLHAELQMLVTSGMTPIQALASATSVTAAAFQLNDRGQIVPGRRADLLLVDGDPTTRIADISKVMAVWKAGVEDDRAGYWAALDQEKQAELAQRQLPPPAGSQAGLVSDFEEGKPTTRFGLDWTAASGRLLGGHKPDAQIDVVDGDEPGRGQALQITGEIAPGILGWAGAMFFPGSTPMAPVNLSSKNAISFWTKGDGRTYQLMLFAKSKGSMPLAKSFTAGPEWQQITIPFADFGTDGSDLQGLMFAELTAPGPFRFLIDNVRLETAPAGQAGSSERNWRMDGTFYFWLQGIHGNVSALGQNIGFKASPRDLASYANVGLQGLVGAQYSRLILLGDVLWTPLTVTKSQGSALPLPVGVSMKIKYQPVILNPEVGYRLIDSQRIKIDALTGVHYWHLGAEISLTPSPAGSGVSKSSNWSDPVVGARIQIPLTPKLTATILGDAGGWGVGSQLDYHMVGALSYRINRKWAIDTAWRYLCDDYRQDQFHSRTAQSGLLLGVTYAFK